MNVPNLKRMTAEDYALWAERQETGRFELIDGMVVQMNAERSDHAQIKLNIALALRQAAQELAVSLATVYGDGMAVRISDRIVHEPDAMMRLGTRLPAYAIFCYRRRDCRRGPEPQHRPHRHRPQAHQLLPAPPPCSTTLLKSTPPSVLSCTTSAALDGQPIMRPPISTGEVVLDPPGLSISTRRDLRVGGVHRNLDA